MAEFVVSIVDCGFSKRTDYFAYRAPFCVCVCAHVAVLSHVLLLVLLQLFSGFIAAHYLLPHKNHAKARGHK